MTLGGIKRKQRAAFTQQNETWGGGKWFLLAKKTVKIKDCDIAKFF